MAVEIAALATTLVSSFLVPLAKKGFDRIKSDMTETAGDAAASGMEKVWLKVKSLFTSERDQGRLEDLEQAPEEAAPMLEKVLKEKLEANPETAEELDRMVNSPLPAAGGVTLQNIMATTFGYLDARNARIGGNARVAAVMVGDPGSPAAPSPVRDKPGDATPPRRP
jgi:hypothetical protein